MTLFKRILAIMPVGKTAGLSTLAPEVDRAFNTALYVGAGLGLLLVGGLAFSLMGRRAPSAKASESRTASFPWVMVVWCLVMFAIACGLFWVGYVPYLHAAVAPGDAYEIQATSDKGSWSFAYPSGKVSVNRLVVPRLRPIRLVMSSKDDVHSLYLPEFRLQQVAIPGRYTSIWFEATKTTSIPIQCAEDCPPLPAKSEGTVSIVEPQQFDEWLAMKDRPKRNPTSAQNGAKP